MRWTRAPLQAKKHKYVNKTCAHIQTTGDKHEPNIVSMHEIVTDFTIWHSERKDT